MALKKSIIITGHVSHSSIALHYLSTMAMKEAYHLIDATAKEKHAQSDFTDAIPINPFNIPEIELPFTPPPTRAERRKTERDKKKK